METSSFDRIARLLGGATSRRASLGIAVAALLGATAAPATARRPRRQGPCGDFSRAANICTTDSDCCTGICNSPLGKDNKDGAGRCRCVHRGGACTEDRNCCSRRGQGMVCAAGICGEACVALQAPCTENDVCCAGVCAQAAVDFQPKAVFIPICCILVGNSGCASDDDCCDPGVCTQGVCLYD
jgi:hypothetical protein